MIESISISRLIEFRTCKIIGYSIDTDMCLYRDPSRVDRIESISISIKVDRIQNMKNNRI